MSFTCPRCSAVSHNPKDELEGYCGACHDFTRTRVVDYPSYIVAPFGERRTWPQIKEDMDRIKEILRSGSNLPALPWKGHGLYAAVHGHEAPPDKEWTLEEIEELSRLYIQKCKENP